MNFFKLIRFSTWWNYKVPPMLFVVYFFIAINKIELKSSLLSIILFLIWVIGTGGLGYIFNDISDTDSDKLAGKENQISSVSMPKRIVIILLLFAIACVPWFFLPLNSQLIILVIGEILLLFLYSFLPFRLKERPYAGIIADALFGHVIIILISAMTFNQMGMCNSIGYGFYALLIIWQLLTGLRNILLHQIDDRENDIRSGTMTFVVKYGQVFSKKLVKRIVFPLEFLIFSVVLGFISHHLQYFYLSFGIFLIMIFLKFSLWRFFTMPSEQIQLNKYFIYFLNDFYELWMPVTALLYLLSGNFEFIFLLIVHLLLFYPAAKKFTADMKSIIIYNF